MVGRSTFADLSPELQAWIADYTANEKVVYERAVEMADAHKKRVGCWNAMHAGKLDVSSRSCCRFLTLKANWLVFKRPKPWSI